MKFKIVAIITAAKSLVKIILLLSALCRWFDNVIIDGIVNGVASAAQIFGWLTRQLQTGRIQNYLLFLLIGILVIIIFCVIYW